MNEADPSPFNLDELRLLPDWLREEGPPPSKQYATHEGARAEDYEGRRGARPGGGNRDRRDSRPAGGGGGGRPGERRNDGGRRPGGPGPRRDGGDRRPERDERRPEPVAAAPVRVEFVPDEKCLVSIVKQIRSTHMAYPLFGLARMFLQEPARHWVQFSVVPGAAPDAGKLNQLGEEGPVTLDRGVLERIAFDSSKDQFYAEQTEQKEPPKGNFTNVARNRLNGALLGPTNYHAYQTALRTDYDQGFSRRMSFEDYRRNVEVVSDPALVERWKEEARTTTSIVTREGDPPMVLASAAEAKAHFRQHYFEGLLRTGTTLKVHGSVARNLPEPAMMQAIRLAHDTELRYPAQFVQFLRQGLQNAGLHIFKHRKRVVYVSLARPTPFMADGAVSENVAAILEAVAQFPLCTRKALAEHVLARRFGPGSIPAPAQPVKPVDDAPAAAPAIPPEPEIEASASPSESVGEALPDPVAGAGVPVQPEGVPPVADDPLSKAKTTLAADLRFLVQSGHLIEFHNGTFDLPLPPKPKEEPRASTSAKRADAVEAVPLAAAPEAVPGSPADDAERAALTLGSVEILPPSPSPEAELAATFESGLEKTEAQPMAETVAAGHPGLSSTDPQEVAQEAVVMGDAESAHPFSPL